MISYSGKLVVFLLFLLVSCGGVSEETLTPERTLAVYVDALKKGDSRTVDILKYRRPIPPEVRNGVIAFIFIFALMGALVRITGFDPFLTMFLCRVIDSLSPQSRVMALLATLVLTLAIGYGGWKLLSGLVMKMAVMKDLTVVEGSEKIEVLSTEVRGNRALVRYRVVFKGRSYEREAVLILEGRTWKVDQL